MNLAWAQLWLPSSMYLHGMVQYATNVDEGSLFARAAAGALVAALTPLQPTEVVRPLVTPVSVAVDGPMR
jgi:hypothetical protein